MADVQPEPGGGRMPIPLPSTGHHATVEVTQDCPTCGAANREDARFCKDCGAVVATPAVVPDARPQPAPGRGRRRLIIGAVTGLALAGAAAATLLAGGGGDPEPTDGSLNYATVRRTDLVSVRSLPGEVAAKGEGPRVLGRLSGTITHLAPVGSKVERGERLYSVDGQPVILFYGSLPAWRDMATGVTGTDVKQLKENLDALGFDVGDVGESFTATTETGVQNWQASIGLPRGGVVPLGRVVFAPAALTVAEHLKASGAPIEDGDEIMSTVSLEKIVHVGLVDEDDLAPNDTVTISVAGKEVPGTVTSVDTPEARGSGGEDVSAVATVVPDEAGALAELKDGSTVDVEVFQDSREGVLAVPVTALVARRDGTYAVEVDRGGRIELVTVEPGFYGGDLVEVDGDVREGDRVVVP